MQRFGARYGSLLAAFAACAETPDVSTNLAWMERICSESATTTGIDVSHYQGTIDWSAVGGQGIKFAFVRVSDGTTTPDDTFAANWEGARNAGVMRGAYQYFRPSQDPIAQADLLLAKMGTLQPGDLPPVVDVETLSGVSATTAEARLRQWLAHVEAAIGKRPIIYTAAYFWRDALGNPDLSGYPMWVANYGVECPLVPSPWVTWDFWQYTDAGAVSGIVGPVDHNHFNGSVEVLQAFAGGALTQPVCGDARCDALEEGQCTADCSACPMVPVVGGIVDGSDCLAIEGDVTRRGTAMGEAWMAATVTDVATARGRWTFSPRGAGAYRLEAYVEPGGATAKDVVYTTNDRSFPTDQSVGGWIQLGILMVRAGETIEVELTNASSVVGETVLFDALRLTWQDDPVVEEPYEETEITAGCQASDQATWLVAVALFWWLWRRR